MEFWWIILSIRIFGPGRTKPPFETMSQNWWLHPLTFTKCNFLCTFVFYELSRSWFVFYRTPVSSFWQAGTFQYCFCASRAFFNQIFSRTQEKNKTRQKIQFLLTKPSQIGKVHQRCIYFFLVFIQGRSLLADRSMTKKIGYKNRTISCCVVHQSKLVHPMQGWFLLLSIQI